MIQTTINRRAARRLPYTFARAHGVVLTECENRAALAVRSDAKPEAIAEVMRQLALPVDATLVDAADFERILSNAYAQAEDTTATLLDDAEQDMDLSMLLQELPKSADLLESVNDAPVIRMINALLAQAVRDNASDIHIEPFETRSVVRFRLDGSLKDIAEPHRALHSAMVSRIKVMADLDIAEKRLPQDGRIALHLAGRPVDVRVSTLPTGHGERVVLRLLNKEAGRLDLAKLGMSVPALAAMMRLTAQPHGIVLITGPTGSGKTTTLYAALACIDATVTNVMTVEDPVEYDLDGISQTQVNPRIEMNFARALRAILRQDPDVIMIGEIRDLETAQIAVQSSLTGHLVLATLHTNDTVSAVTRLTDMGVEPFLLSSSIVGVLAQRLVRCLCMECREAYKPDEAELALLARYGKPDVIYRPVGCAKCNQTGYRGRTGIYEMLEVDDKFRSMIHSRESEQHLRDYAMQSGMLNLRDDGLRWVVNGTTSLEEVIRVTRD
ncbi:MAG: type II secretion system ATPase GspE [Sideroxyarcus sp.]|nr:type II secretion system ATPase GspE [Sideroxyarcus sp.]